MTLPIIATRYPDESVGVPYRGTAPGVVGDSFVRILPEHPEYAAWDQWMNANTEQVRVLPQMPAESELPPTLE